MTSEKIDVGELLSREESNTLEFKRELHDLASNSGRGEFVKDVLALSNCTAPERKSYMVIGVQDARHGGKVVGVERPLNGEQIAQILAEYCEPVPEVHVSNVSYRRKTIGLVEIAWSPMFPYFARRDLGGTLISGAGYVRRDGVVGKLTPAEMEHLLRAKAARLGPAIIQDPLLCGFIGFGHFHGPRGPILRVANVSEATIQEVRVTFDIVWKLDASVFRRQPSFEGPLNSGESRELELDLRSLYLETPDGKGISQSSGHAKWLDVTARIEFRNRHGLLSELQAHAIVLD